VVRIATQQFLKAARSEITGSDWQAVRWKKILSYIKSETKRRQPVSRSSLLRKFHLPASEMEKILNALAEAREIEAVAVADPRPGRPGTYYRAMG
jgi:tRNA G26 N,N-dimethylase Trm1